MYPEWDDFYEDYNYGNLWSMASDDDIWDMYDRGYDADFLDAWSEDEWDRILLPRGRGNVERKDYLSKQRAINCGHCPYHRKENRTNFAKHHMGRKPRTFRDLN
jgi:hypothetical protein